MARDYRQMQRIGAVSRKRNNQPNRVDDLIQRIADEAPELTEEQKARLSEVFRRTVGPPRAGGECE